MASNEGQNEPARPDESPPGTGAQPISLNEISAQASISIQEGGAQQPPDNGSQRISLNQISEQVSISVQERVAQQREFARQLIAILIVGSLFVIVVFSYLSLWYKKDGMSITDITDVLEKLISPVAGIVGAVTGFYFGERQREVTAQAVSRE